jgi:hypothetical protein
MRCPQCGIRNTLGSASCSNCGRAFTRAANYDQSRTNPAREQTARTPAGGARQQRPGTHMHTGRQHYYEDEYDDYYEDERYNASRRAAPPPDRRGATSCLTTLVVLLALSVAMIIGLIVATNMFVRPRVAEAVSSHIGAGIETTVRNQIVAELGNLPTGELTISEAEINQRIAERGNLGPVDDLSISINPGGIAADLQAYGLNGAYSADVGLVDGRITLSNSTISGPLQYVVSEADVAQITSEAINRALAEAGYQVEAVTLHDGVLILTLLR